jgi:hypothetical protein
MELNENNLKIAIENKLTYRQIANEFNVSISTIQYWFKQFGLNTIRGNYKPNPQTKINMEIFNQNSDNIFNIDITDVTTKIMRDKHKKSTDLAIFTVEIKNTKLAYIMDKRVIHDKDKICNIMLKLKELFNCDTVVSDKEFKYLETIGFKVFKSNSWNCKTQINDKHYGNLKRWIYPLIKYDKDRLNLNQNEISQNTKLILENYIIQLKNNGYTIIDKTIENRQQQNIIEISN